MKRERGGGERRGHRKGYARRGGGEGVVRG